MFIIKRFRKEKIVKFVVSFLLCVLSLLSFLSVSADEEPTVSLPPPAVATQPTEEPTDSDNIIIEQPHNAVAQGGDTISFNVKVSDNSLVDNFLWVYTADGGVSWVTASSLSGYQTDTLTFIVNRYRATWKYKCILELKNGDTLETRIASIISPSEQQTEPASEQITDFISLTDSFTSSDYHLVTVILLLVLIFVFLLKFIL